MPIQLECMILDRPATIVQLIVKGPVLQLVSQLDPDGNCSVQCCLTLHEATLDAAVSYACPFFHFTLFLSL